MVFRKAIRAYRFNLTPLVSPAPETRLYCSRILKTRHLPHRGVDLTVHWQLTYCVVLGAYVPKAVLELERTAYVLNDWSASPPGRSSRLLWCTQ